MISAVILAVGCDRQQSPRSLDPAPLQLILEGVLASNIDEVVCLTDDLTPARRDIRLSDRRLSWYLSPAGPQGRSASVIAGLWASNPCSDGVMFVSCEPPVVGAGLINLFIEKFETSTAWIVAATSAGRPRGPLLFRRDLFSELLELTGDDTGASLLERHTLNTALVPWLEQPEPASLNERAIPARLKQRV